METPKDNLSTSPPTPPENIKRWVDCKKKLRKLTNPPPEDQQTQFVEQIKNSQQPQQIAFEFLFYLQHTKGTARFKWLEKHMIRLLGDGAEPPGLANLPDPAYARNWVFQQLTEVNTLSEWKKYLESGRHLWLLLAILKCQNHQALMDSLLALAECIADCQNTPSAGKSKKSGINTGDPKWIVQLVKSKIPSKLNLPKAFNDTLFALSATAELNEPLRKERDRLRTQLEITETELEQETAALAASEKSGGELESDLQDTRNELKKTLSELEEEKKHTNRTKGFSGVAKQETINEVLSEVRRGLASKLESIRLYTDREKPDREEILGLVGEIENHLISVEKQLKS